MCLSSVYLYSYSIMCLKVEAYTFICHWLYKQVVPPPNPCHWLSRSCYVGPFKHIKQCWAPQSLSIFTFFGKSVHEYYLCTLNLYKRKLHISFNLSGLYCCFVAWPQEFSTAVWANKRRKTVNQTTQMLTFIMSWVVRSPYMWP